MLTDPRTMTDVALVENCRAETERERGMIGNRRLAQERVTQSLFGECERRDEIAERHSRDGLWQQAMKQIWCTVAYEKSRKKETVAVAVECDCRKFLAGGQREMFGGDE